MRAAAAADAETRHDAALHRRRASAGIRPQDLVGAITGEAGISGGEVGAIDIADRFSLVEVPENLADAVIKALRSSTLKGKRVTVRRDMHNG